MGFIVRRMNVVGEENPGDEGRGEWKDGKEASRVGQVWLWR